MHAHLMRAAPGTCPLCGVLATPVAVWGAWPVFVRGGQSVRRRHLDGCTLLALGIDVSFVYYVIGIPSAPGALYRVFGVVLSPMIGAAATSPGAVSVVANALRLRGGSFT